MGALFLFLVTTAFAESSVWMDFGQGRGVAVAAREERGETFYDPFLAAPPFRIRPHASERPAECLAVAMPMAPLEIWSLRFTEDRTDVTFRFRTASGQPFAISCRVPPQVWRSSSRTLDIPALLAGLGVTAERIHIDEVGIDRGRWQTLNESVHFPAPSTQAIGTHPFESVLRSLGGRSAGEHCYVSLTEWMGLGVYASRVMTFADFVCLQVSETLGAQSIWGPSLDNGRGCLPTREEALRTVRASGHRRYEFSLNTSPRAGWRGPSPVYRTHATARPYADGRVVLTKRIRFQPADSALRPLAEERLADAQRIYTESAREAGFPLEYRFISAAPGEDFDEAIELHLNNGRSDADDWFAGDLRGPDGKAFVLHELGHLFGWIDEYGYDETVRGSATSVCLSSPAGVPSIMCAFQAQEARLQPYHHYLVLRTMACAR